MLRIELKGRIDENGQLQVTLPTGLPPGEVEITLHIVSEGDQASETWTQDELDDMLIFKAATGEEIAASGVFGGWAHRDDITDSEEFIQEIRRREQERSKWSEESEDS